MCWSEKGHSKKKKKNTGKKCEGNIGEAVEQEEMLCFEVETVSELIN